MSLVLPVQCWISNKRRWDIDKIWTWLCEGNCCRLLFGLSTDNELYLPIKSSLIRFYLPLANRVGICYTMVICWMQIVLLVNIRSTEINGYSQPNNIANFVWYFRNWSIVVIGETSSKWNGSKSNWHSYSLLHNVTSWLSGNT